ncbi:DUF2059 domain-containing protein [Aestuariibacter sp. GS-14]|uniref:DUF2059 domain-containing protein n=1 Tax=Alteromonadaceae TaxID=72275 RepID=UPI00112AB73D|nr:DUF2059 domain-containing protein [Aestuariibacter sp. GS-14]TPV61739.1 DUF2059 domain-containing protein [Aestuariibacter sp. GS-14]
MRIWICVFIALFSVSAKAAEPAMEKAMLVAQALGGEASKEMLIAQFKHNTGAALSRFQITTEERPLVEQFMRELDTILRNKLNEPALNNAIANIYLTHFTEQEMDQILAFYHSPIGQKMRSQSQPLSDAFREQLVSHMRGAVPELEKLSADLKNTLEAGRRAKSSD